MQFHKSNIIIEFVQLAEMKAIFNGQLQTHVDNQPSEQLQKRLTELKNANKDRETLISNLEKEVTELQQNNVQMEEQLKNCEEEWKQLLNEQQEQKCESQEEQEMNQWIESVQKHNGLPQQSIDTLLTMEFEGGQNEICLSCYNELSTGALCTYLPCSHLFHKQCIGNHLKVNKHCPACQEAIML